MHADEFWEIVDGCKRESGGSFALRTRLLAASLASSSASELHSFAQHFSAAVDQAHTVDLMQAADLMSGGVSEDGFVYFRRWLVSLGSRVHHDALADADTLADVELGAPGGEDDCLFEEIFYVAQDVHMAKTGHPIVLPAPSLEEALARRQRQEALLDASAACPLPRLRRKYSRPRERL
ncbi:MAG: DUF4240 domain-containing protein [Sandaracinaceae bacterium]|nr:MAG: DUF4240 domain-containing protein [Sandaracinaceae bacterium]